MKVALVHDYLKEFGGAERVLEAMHEIWPEAPIFTAFVDFDGLGPHAERIRKWDIKTSWVQRIWPVKKLHSPLRFITPWVWKYFDFSGYDVVITSSAWYIPRGIVTKPPTKHICYMHTPPRHLYGYETASNWRKYWVVRVYGNFINHFLRMYDYNTAQRVDYFIANSKETQKRIKKFYRRESKIIYPPVDSSVTKFLSETNSSSDVTSDTPAVNSYMENLPKNKPLSRSKTLSERADSDSRSSKNLSPSESTNYQLPATNYYLCVSRLARAKHIDLAIKACQKLGKPLVVVGKGKESAKLKAQSVKLNSETYFLGEVSDEELNKIYKSAKALIFPAEDEEFGIVPVEAMGRGVPVIAYKSGGVQETVIEGKTGVFFDELNVKSLIKTLKHKNIKAIKRKDCIQQAKKFSKERFKKEIKKFVLDKL